MRHLYMENISFSRFILNLFIYQYITYIGFSFPPSNNVLVFFVLFHKVLIISFSKENRGIYSNLPNYWIGIGKIGNSEMIRKVSILGIILPSFKLTRQIALPDQIWRENNKVMLVQYFWYFTETIGSIKTEMRSIVF